MKKILNMKNHELKLKLNNKFDDFIKENFKIKIKIQKPILHKFMIDREETFFIWFWEIFKYYKKGYFYVPIKFKK